MSTSAEQTTETLKETTTNHGSLPTQDNQTKKSKKKSRNRKQKNNDDITTAKNPTVATKAASTETKGKQELTIPQESKNTKETVIFMCLVDAAGEGDLGHFIDIAKPKYVNAKLEALKDFNIVRIVACKKGLVEGYQEKLKEHGMQDTIFLQFNPTSYNAPFTDISKELAQTIKHCLCIFNISTPHLPIELFKVLRLKLNAPNSPLVVNLGEHLGTSFNPADVNNNFSYRNDVTYRIMGSALSHHGFLLDDGLQERLTNSQSLSNIKDKTFIKLLTGKANGVLEDKEAAEFLKTHFLIPGHFQEGAHSFAAILQGIVSSAIIQNPNNNKITEVTFVINAGAKDAFDRFSPNYDPTVIDTEYLKKYEISEIHHVEITQKEKTKIKKESTLSINPAGRLKIRIISGYYLKNDEDYDNLFGAANTVCGCSGDKSWERAVKKRKIPILQQRLSKQSFFSHLLDRLSLLLQKHEYLMLRNFMMAAKQTNETYFPEQHRAVTLSLRTSFHPSLLFNLWPKLFEYIEENLNFYKVLPHIIAQGVFHSRLGKLNLQQGAKHRLEDSEKLEGKEKEVDLKTTLQQRIVDLDNEINRSQNEYLVKYKNQFQKSEKEALEVNGRFISSVHLRQVFKALKGNPKLKRIDLCFNLIDVRDMFDEFLDFIKSLPNLDSLELSQSHFEDDHIIKLCKVLESKHGLRVLDLSQNDFSSKGAFVAISVLLQKIQLRDLNLDQNKIGLKEANYLLTAIPKSHLEKLTVKETPICLHREMMMQFQAVLEKNERRNAEKAAKTASNGLFFNLAAIDSGAASQKPELLFSESILSRLLDAASMQSYLSLRNTEQDSSLSSMAQSFDHKQSEEPKKSGKPKKP